MSVSRDDILTGILYVKHSVDSSSPVKMFQGICWTIIFRFNYSYSLSLSSDKSPSFVRYANLAMLFSLVDTLNVLMIRFYQA